jgi:hypothetical protein
MFQPLDVVRLKNGLSDHDLPAGTKAVILEASDLPEPHYQIEVADRSGRAIFIGAVTADQVESA